MKVLKHKKCDKFLAVEKCCFCHSKLEIEAKDVQPSIYGKDVYTCPVCQQINILTDKNTKKFKLYYFNKNGGENR